MKCILVVDLEATCWDDRPQSCETMEIIEFGCALARLDGTVVTSKNQLVSPKINPKLTGFCQSLTGIKQSEVDTAPLYLDAIKLVDNFCQTLNFDAWGSWGQYDHNQIAAEKKRWGVAPDFFKVPHINLKLAFQKTVGRRRNAGLGNALQFFGMEFMGQQHRALDDALNIARIIPHIDQAHFELDDIGK